MRDPNLELFDLCERMGADLADRVLLRMPEAQALFRDHPSYFLDLKGEGAEAEVCLVLQLRI